MAEEHKKRKIRDGLLWFIGKAQKGIYESHLYKSKGVSVFKTTVLGLTLFGGVYRQETPVAIYMFSLTILAEYAVQLVLANKFLLKLLPILLTAGNLASFIFSFGQIARRCDLVAPWQKTVALGTFAVVFADMLLILLIEPPTPPPKVENRLAACGRRVSQRY